MGQGAQRACSLSISDEHPQKTDIDVLQSAPPPAGSSSAGESAVTEKQEEGGRHAEEGAPPVAELQEQAELTQAAVKIQAVARGHQVRKQQKEEELAAVKLQAAARGHLARKQAKEEQAAIVKIQAVARGKLARKQAQEEKDAIVKVQAVARGKLARKQKQQDEQAIVKLQAIARGKLARKQLEEEEKAAIKIQAIARGKQARKQKAEEEKAIVKIQAIARGKLARQQSKQEREKIVKLQAVARGKIARRQRQKEEEAIVKVQAVARGKLARSKTKELLEQKKQSAAEEVAGEAAAVAKPLVELPSGEEKVVEAVAGQGSSKRRASVPTDESKRKKFAESLAAAGGKAARWRRSSLLFDQLDATQDGFLNFVEIKKGLDSNPDFQVQSFVESVHNTTGLNRPLQEVVGGTGVDVAKGFFALADADGNKVGPHQMTVVADILWQMVDRDEFCEVVEEFTMVSRQLAALRQVVDALYDKQAIVRSDSGSANPVMSYGQICSALRKNEKFLDAVLGDEEMADVQARLWSQLEAESNRFTEREELYDLVKDMIQEAADVEDSIMYAAEESVVQED